MMQSQRAGSVVEAQNCGSVLPWCKNTRGFDEKDELDVQDGPVSAVHQNHSVSIVETREDLKAKAESQFADARASAVAE